MTPSARRILAVLECRRSDQAVLDRSLALAADSGGYLTLVAVVPRPFLVLWSGPYYTPRVSQEELREQAAQTLAWAAALVPADVPLITATDHGRVGGVIARRVAVAAHDLVVVRRCFALPARARHLPAPVLAVAT